MRVARQEAREKNGIDATSAARAGPSRSAWLRVCVVCYTTIMSIETTTSDVDAQEQADAGAILRHAFEGAPLDPDVSQRVRERAARITEEIRRAHGLIDDETFHNLLRDDDEP